MSKQLRMGINALSFTDKESKTIQYAVKANVSFTYKVVDEGCFESVEGTVEADKKVQRLVESLFTGCFIEVISKKPRVQWPMCGDEITAYVKEKALMHGKGVEIEEFNLQSINDDPQYRAKMEQMQKGVNEQNATKETKAAPVTSTSAETPVESNEATNPFANGMDMKKIAAIVIVIILLIIGYFMK